MFLVDIFVYKNRYNFFGEKFFAVFLNPPHQEIPDFFNQGFMYAAVVLRSASGGEFENTIKKYLYKKPMSKTFLPEKSAKIQFQFFLDFVLFYRVFLGYCSERGTPHKNFTNQLQL
jgi:hypothetical protein